MGRPSNTDQRRSQITRALMKVMARRGYDGASIAEIAKAARLTSGLVHYHFESKQEILLAALDEIVARHDSRLDERLTAAGGDPRLELEAFIELHLGLGADADPEILACWILLSGEALRDSRVRAGFEKAMRGMAARVSDVIRRGVERKLFTCDAPDAAAGALVALVQGYYVLAAAAREVIPRGSAARAARHMAAGLLHPSRPPGPSGARP